MKENEKNTITAQEQQNTVVRSTTPPPEDLKHSNTDQNENSNTNDSLLAFLIVFFACTTILLTAYAVHTVFNKSNKGAGVLSSSIVKGNQELSFDGVLPKDANIVNGVKQQVNVNDIVHG